MITGAHSILYSKNPVKDREFLRDVLGFPSVDAGDGWLIFGLPPSEVAVHPSEKNDVHEFYLMCDDVIYQPRHARPKPMSVKKTAARKKKAPARRKKATARTKRKAPRRR